MAQGASRGFNPSLPQSVVNRALAYDPRAASAAYPDHFRSDLEAFNSRDLSQSAVDVGALVRAPFNPTQATAEVRTLLKDYRIHSVRGDNNTSAIYWEALPLFTSNSKSSASRSVYGPSRIFTSSGGMVEFVRASRRTRQEGKTT